MDDLGKALEEKAEIITERWIQAVHQDSEIKSAKQLAYEAVRNSLPDVLSELAGLLSKDLSGEEEELERKSFHHGFARAEQGYDTAEIVREYRLLRQTILSVLESNLLSGSTQDLLDSIRLIDGVFDEIIADSLESYIRSRLIELQQMQSQLTLTNQELNRLVRVQKDNLSYMAHELKTPLTSIIGHSNILLRNQQQKLEGRDTATNLDQIERVLRNGRRLLQIINDTLEISRYNEGQIQLNLSLTNLDNLIQETVQDGLGPLAEEKGLNLSVETSQAPQNVMTDPLRIQQLVTNLVSNAIRYTEEGNIWVICHQVNEQFWELKVIDTGIGIEEKVRSLIFDPYNRNFSNATSATGLGLGLAIVERIVHLMEGSIQVESEVGKGSTFTVILPIAKPG